MAAYYSYNGQLFGEGRAIVSPDNRGLRYGDGLFETMKMINGEVLFFPYHVDRLFEGLKLLLFELPAFFTAEFVLKQVKELCKKNRHTNARIRLSIVRGNGGLFDPENHQPNFIIQSWKIEEPLFRLNENGLVAGIYSKARKIKDDFSNLKTNNYLCYAMAALHVKQQRWNEAILLNNDNNLCDATIANVFVVKNDIIKTPSLQEGCVAGVMRRHLLENLAGKGFQCDETVVSVDDILSADEVFFTNVMQGIRWAKQCGDKEYGHSATEKIFQSILKAV